MRKTIIIAAFVLIVPIVCFASYALYRVGRAAQAIERIAINAEPRVTTTLDHVQGCALSLQASADLNREVLARPQVQRSIMLVAQSGDDFARSIKKLNHLMDLIGDGSIPRFDALLDSGREAVDSTNVAVSTLSIRGAEAIVGFDQLVKIVRERAEDPNFARLLAGLADTSEQSAATLRGLNVSREEIVEAHIELMKKLGNGVDQYGRLGSEGADFMHGLNKPKSKKEKLMRALIQAAAIAAPAVLRR